MQQKYLTMKKKKEMISLTYEENESYLKQEVCHLCKKEFITDIENIKYRRVRDHCHYAGKHRSVAYSICNLRYKTLKEIPTAFHNGSKYDYHFIIKDLAKGFDGQFKCLGENTAKYITFSVPIKKEVDNGKKINFIVKFIIKSC